MDVRSTIEHGTTRPAESDRQSTADIKPYIQSLTLQDLESCMALETATFPPHERCTRPKFHYRFATCAELSLGLFTSADPSIFTSQRPSPGDAPTARTSSAVDSATPGRKAILIAHVIATKTTNSLLRDEDMDIPSSWPDAPSPVAAQGKVPGHKEEGRTVCLHSLAVLPEYQGKGLGSLLLRSWLGRIKDSGTADRVAIIAHQSLKDYYEKFGFKDEGESPVKFGGGGWRDMVLEIEESDSEDEEEVVVEEEEVEVEV